MRDSPKPVRSPQTCSLSWRNEIGENCHDEGLRAALDGPKKVGTPNPAKVPCVPTSCNFRAPVAELVYAHGLQPCDHSGLPGPNPGWGTTSAPSQNLCDTNA